MAALLGSASEAEAFEARAGQQRKRQRTIFVCVVVGAVVVLIPTAAVGSRCASGRCGDKASALPGSDVDVGSGGGPTAPPTTTAKTTANASFAITVHDTLRDAAPTSSWLSSSSSPTQRPSVSASTSFSSSLLPSLPSSLSLSPSTLPSLSPSSTSPTPKPAYSNWTSSPSLSPSLLPTGIGTLLDGMPETEAPSASSWVQPRVTLLEGRSAHRGFASLSNPDGTPWCDGGPMFWVTGHQKDDESPFCLRDGQWVLHNRTHLDSEDALNHNTIDRHSCVTMDVNRDGRDDVLCNVGANKGKGKGYNELYITQADGSLKKIQSGHGLQKYPTMRNRIAVTLRDATGVKSLVLFTTLGKPRPDGRTNVPRMFRNVYKRADTLPYFVEVPGPWRQHLFEATCAISGDFSGDWRDDVIICDPDGRVRLVTQGPFTTFLEVEIPNVEREQASGWGNARLADVNRDGIQDVVIVTGSPKFERRKSADPTLKIFLGIRSEPYFDFREPYFEANLPWDAPDLEVLDVNNDGIVDVYVVQVDSRKGKYCGPGRHTGPKLSPEFVPPVDEAHDVLFVGTPDSTRPFVPVTMNDAWPGCGSFVQKWDMRTMLLSGGSFDNAGYSMLLEW